MPVPLDREDALIARARSGDAAAYEQLIAPLLPMLVAYARAICGDHQRAEDVAQETALVVFRNLDRFFPEADFASWVKAIARRQALAARRQSARLHPLLDDAIEATFADPSPDHLLVERSALRACLAKLHAQAASVVRAHYFDGQSVAAVGERLGLNPNTIKTLLQRSRLALHDCLQRALRVEARP